MKFAKHLNLLFIASTVLILVAAGCGEQKKDSIDSKLMVVRQFTELEGDSEGDVGRFAVDVPVKGPQPLLDSIKAFLNQELYEAFQDYACDTFLYKAEEVYVDDMVYLLSSYSDKYNTTIKEKISWFFDLNIFIIAQTESFVTYGIECYHGSGSTGSKFICHTFSKKDGHRIENLITKHDLARYDKEHPTEKIEDVENESENFDWDYYSVGLTGEGLLLVNNEVNHYVTRTIEYETILPYLSKEAQELVKAMGESAIDCFIGERIGTVNSADGRTIILTETLTHSWSDDGYLDEFWDYAQLTQLNAFYITKDGYEPANVIDGKSVSEANWDLLISSNPNKTTYAFDADNNDLYSPLAENVEMGRHDCCDRYQVWHFDGKEFVLKGEDGGYWLHPSLRKFGRLCYVGDAEDYLVRIDEMRIYDPRYDDQAEALKKDTHRFRYAAWKNQKNMSEVPDLVIENGYCDVIGNGYGSVDEVSYIFENDGYHYDISVILGQMIVYRNGKSIMERRIHDITF